MKNKYIDSFNETRKISQTVLQKMTENMKNGNKVYLQRFWEDKKRIDFLFFKKDCEIVVEDSTSIMAAIKYKNFDKVAVLNFANPVIPGGDVICGVKSQEGSLCMCSNLYEALTDENLQDFYQYHECLHNEFFSDRLIYTSNVIVLKNDSSFIPEELPRTEWFQIDVITCAAPYHGYHRYLNRTVLKNVFKSRIKNIFEAAIDNKADCIILGAFGCGDYMNPPDVVAAAFSEVIDENSYKKHFKKIVFAIKRTSRYQCPNLKAFEKVFYGISEKILIPPFGVDAIPFGEMWLVNNNLIRDREVFAEYRKWKKNNRYYGKQFSILGDSISTLEGFNPPAHSVFYTDENKSKSQIYSMLDTWWGMVIEYFGGELLVNDSWSGSCVTKAPENKELFPSGCSDERTSRLHIGDIKPDVIIIYLGFNDWTRGTQIDDDFPTVLLFDDEANGENKSYADNEIFAPAYDEMLRKLKNHYPDSEIWCCTLPTTTISDNKSFSFPFSYGGKHIEKYNDVIRRSTELYNCKLVDLYGFNIAYDSIDGTHPSRYGMETIATMFIRSILGQDESSFLNCVSRGMCDGHIFMAQEKSGEFIKYICKRCAFTEVREKTGSEIERRPLLKNLKTYEQEKVVEFNELNSQKSDEKYDPQNGLILLEKESQKEQRFQKTNITVGRESKCDLRFSDHDDSKQNLISRQHARFMFFGDKWYICDTNSKNGTFINGRELKKQNWYALHCGDVVNFATKYEYVFLNEPIKRGDS